MYIMGNALIDHDGNFSKTAKNVCTNSLFWHFMLISRVNFVTLAQIISETEHCKKIFLLAGNSS